MGKSTTLYFERSDRALILVKGKDHISFLQNMLTNNVLTFKTGDSGIASFCTNKGKLVADMLLYMLEDHVLLDLAKSNSDHFIQAISKFIISEDVEMESVAKSVFTVFSFADADRVLLKQSLTSRGGVFSLKETKRPYLTVFEKPQDTMIQPATVEQFEQFRILEGIPSWGQDISADHFPVESDFLGKGISYNKGCYIGQETMARLYSRGGNVAHKLMGLVTKGPQAEMLDSKVFLDDKEVGKITSVTTLATDETLGMGMLHRSAAEENKEVKISAGREVYPGRVIPLPLPLG